MDRKISRAICFNKDDTDSGEDDNNKPYDIVYPSAGAANDRVRPANNHGYDSDVTDPDNKSIFTDEYGRPIPRQWVFAISSQLGARRFLAPTKKI